MLSSDLLRARTRRGRIYPQFCRVSSDGAGGDDAESGLASELASMFADAHAGGTRRGDLYAAISAMEPDYDYKLVRGLRTLLERRSTFEPLGAAAGAGAGAGGTDPARVRRAVFAESSESGLAIDADARDRILQKSSRACGVAPSEISDVMWADLEENQVLARFDPISVRDLLLWYNMSLAQTLLFGCTRMTFYVDEGPYWKDVLRAVKASGLMYVMEARDGRPDGPDAAAAGGSTVPLRCILDGPLSLFKLTTRYGTAFARLLPVITRTPVWEIDASISKKSPGGAKMYRFELSNDSAREFLRVVDQGRAHAEKGSSAVYSMLPHATGAGGRGPARDASHMQQPPQQQYDSSVEKKFADILHDHLSLDDPLGWRITREPGPLISGNKAMLPDFLLERMGRRVYLEIVGFWTPDYIRRKFEKLRTMLGDGGSSQSGAGRGGIDMLVGIDASLLCSQPSSDIMDIPGVFAFGRHISVRPILEHLRGIDAEIERDAASGAPPLGADDLGADVARMRDVALRHLVPEAAVPGMFESTAPGRYTAVGPCMISNEKISELSGRLDGGRLGFVDVCAMLAGSGIPDDCHADLLSHMGYDVVWPDLDPGNACIQKRSGGA